MKSSQFYDVICVAICLAFFLKKWWPSTWLHLWLPNPPYCFRLPHHNESLCSHLPSGVNESLWNSPPLCLSKVAIARTLLFQFSVRVLSPPWTIPALVVSLLGFIFEPRAFAASVAFDFILDFKTIPKGALSRYCFKGSLARHQFVERVVITGWKTVPRMAHRHRCGSWWSRLLCRRIRLRFWFKSTAKRSKRSILGYCFNGSLVNGQLVERVIIAGWKT